jgi:hypothetical protein
MFDQVVGKKIPNKEVFLIELTAISWLCRRGSVVERFLGKEKVMGSIPIVGSKIRQEVG